MANRAELATTSGIEADELAAAFTARSYRPHTRARLRIWARARRLTFQIFVCGRQTPGERFGAPVSEAWSRPWTQSGKRRTIRIRVRAWASGLYLLRLTTPNGRRGYAPFVVRPSPLGSARIAVFLPTNTWQAYNFRDMNGDGVGDTWYADPSIHVLNLARPYLRPGLPRLFGYYTVPFLRWLRRHDKKVDFYADDDFSRFRSGGWLARHYALMVFSGHEEYVTPTEYTLTRRDRNHGGNLAFLSANNFFYRVTRDGDRLYGRTRWRDLGRPEAALIGVQYVGWFQGIYEQKPYVVRGARSDPWLFTGTGLRNGDRFGRFGIEVDMRAPSSPSSTRLLARIRDIFGPGKTAEMTYYRRGGAKVFAAGVLNFAARAGTRVGDRMITNIFAKLEVRR